MATSQSKYGRRFDEEFKREVAALACRPGARQEQVARDLGVEPLQRVAREEALRRWRRARAGRGRPRFRPWRQRAGTGAAHPCAGARVRRSARAAHDPKKSGRHFLRTPAMKRATIKQLAGQPPIRQLCRVRGVARSAYYAAQRKAARPRATANTRLGARARALFEASGRTSGSPRLTVALRRAGAPCGRHRVARLMRRAGRRARQKRRFRPRTMDSRHLCPIAPNRLAERAAPPARPGEVWQADITRVAAKEGWLYVAGVLDASARAGSWAGRRTTPCPPRWSPVPSSAPPPPTGPAPGCSPLPAGAASTPATPTANCCAATASPRAGAAPASPRAGAAPATAMTTPGWRAAGPRSKAN